MPEPNSSTSSFKHFLLRILLPLLLIVSVAGIAFNYGFERLVILNSEVVGAYKVHRILSETHSGEVPIFGSSRAEGGFIPDSLGTNYFNYGLSGSKYDVTLFFVEQECNKQKSTPYILLNLDLDGLTYGLGDIANYIPDARHPAIKKLLDTNYHSYYRIPLLKYYGLYESYTRDNLNNKLQLTKFTNKGAAIEKKALTNRQFAELVQQRKNTTTTFTADSALLGKLDNIIITHPSRYFIFVVSPYHSSYFERYTNYPEAMAFLSHLGAMKNVHVFDFSKMSLADSMFFNTAHLNYKGAKSFNHRLKDSLISLGIR